MSSAAAVVNPDTLSPPHSAAPGYASQIPVSSLVAQPRVRSPPLVRRGGGGGERERDLTRERDRISRLSESPKHPGPAAVTSGGGTSMGLVHGSGSGSGAPPPPLSSLQSQLSPRMLNALPPLSGKYAGIPLNGPGVGGTGGGGGGGGASPLRERDRDRDRERDIERDASHSSRTFDHSRMSPRPSSSGRASPLYRERDKARSLALIILFYILI